MSSSPRSRPELVSQHLGWISQPAVRAARSAAPVLVVLAVLWLGVPGAAAVPAGPGAVPLPGVTVLPVAGRQVSLVVDASGSTQPTPSDSFSVSVAGTRQPASVTPVMSNELAVAMVVDASQAGAGQLASWVSGAARFVL